ncbi:MAG TPA: hypothetical protein VER55_03380 [Ardenticatenaceae bacterium]|nr:hypothetical protein [Ardenticatenaceae bacterium]
MAGPIDRFAKVDVRLRTSIRFRRETVVYHVRLPSCSRIEWIEQSKREAGSGAHLATYAPPSRLRSREEEQ